MIEYVQNKHYKEDKNAMRKNRRICATKKSCGFLGLSLVILLSNQQTE